MGGLPLPSSLGAYKILTSIRPRAANTEFSITLAKAAWVISVSVALVQGATQTPQPILVIDDGTTTFFEMFGSSAAQAVSTTCRYTWAGDVQLTGQVGSATTNVHSMGPLPQNLVLPAGYRIRSSTLGLGANSDYGVAAAYVCELG
jgi:hypothetical protein